MNDAVIEAPAYIVLHIPSPMAEMVRKARAKYDPSRSFLPAEITLTGSCGAGHIKPGTMLETVTKEMDRIAALYSPFSASFGQVGRFDNTEIYFLNVQDATPFTVLHQAFKDSAIPFLPNTFPYKPHCTLKLRQTPDDVELMELLFMNFPQTPFSICEMALYALPDMQSCDLLYQAELHGQKVPGK